MEYDGDEILKEYVSLMPWLSPTLSLSMASSCFFRAIESEALVIKDILAVYKNASGQYIN